VVNCSLIIESKGTLAFPFYNTETCDRDLDALQSLCTYPLSCSQLCTGWAVLVLTFAGTYVAQSSFIRWTSGQSSYVL